MSKEKQSVDEKLSIRFYKLNFAVTIVLLAAILISISQFGEKTWQNRKQIALIIPGEKNELGWNRSQYLAVKSVCDELDYEFVLRENVPADYESCKKVTDDLAKRGVESIYFSNGCLLTNVEKFEKEHPKISFCTIESISALTTSGRYSILSFEVSYLAGILAGLHTHTNKIGYIAPYLESEVNQGINAFAIGVQRVNPEAEVLLNWTGAWDNRQAEEQAVQNLKAQRVDVLTYHQNGDTIPNSAERLGINFIAYNESYPNNAYCLASIKFDWTAIYNDLIKYKNSEITEGSAFGISEGAVMLETSKNISRHEQVLIDTAKWEIENGRIIFAGDIFDKNGVRHCAANEAISFQMLQNNMNWLIKGVRNIGN